jgi:hypothetical protein
MAKHYDGLSVSFRHQEKLMASNACDALREQLRELEEDVAAALAAYQNDQDEPPGSKGQAFQEWRLLRMELGRVRARLSTCVGSNTPRPDLMCRPQRNLRSVSALERGGVIRLERDGTKRYWSPIVYNIGNADATGTFRIALASSYGSQQIGRVDEQVFASVTVRAGQSFTPSARHEAFWEISAVELVRLYVVLDVDSQIRERSEANNSIEYLVVDDTVDA